MTIPTPSIPPRVLLEPPERCYWAVVDAATLGVGVGVALSRVRRADVAAALEQSLVPAPDTLTYALAVAADSRVVICLHDEHAVEAARHAGLLHLGPVAIPETLGVRARAEDLNLLVAGTGPLPLRRARRAEAIAVVLFILVAAALSVAGIEIRRARASFRATLAREELRGALSATGARSVAELVLRRDAMAATRRRFDAPEASPEDAAVALAALLSAWPRGAAAPLIQTQSISAARAGLTLQFLAHSRDDATRMASLLTAFPALSAAGPDAGRAWTLSQPQIAAAGAPGDAHVRGSFRFTPAPSPATLERPR
ncbi:hypothetical protein BH11PLA1_BH11PLA1_01470 [soil metagenome]